MSDSTPPAEHYVCTNHPDSPDPCPHPATHRIITADGTVRAHACRIAERYMNEGERSEPLIEGTAIIKFAPKRAPNPSPVMDVSDVMADVKRLRSLIPSENAEAHALLAQIAGRIAMLG